MKLLAAAIALLLAFPAPAASQTTVTVPVSLPWQALPSGARVDALGAAGPLPGIATPINLIVDYSNLGTITAAFPVSPSALSVTGIELTTCATGTWTCKQPMVIDQAVQIAVPAGAQLSLALNAATANLSLSYAAPALAALSPTSLSMPLGGMATLNASLAYVNAIDLLVALSSSDPSVTVPASVVIPAGALGALVTVTGAAVGISTVTASLNGASALSHVTVLAPPAPAPPPTTASTSVAGDCSSALTLATVAKQGCLRLAPQLTDKGGAAWTLVGTKVLRNGVDMNVARFYSDVNVILMASSGIVRAISPTHGYICDPTNAVGAWTSSGC